MRSQGNDALAGFLLWSSVAFAIIMGILAFGDIYIYELVKTPVGASNPIPATLMAEYALSVTPGAMLSWWMTVAIPRQANAFAGGCAGLFTVVFAVLGVMLVAIFSLPHPASHATGVSVSLPLWGIPLLLLLWISSLIRFAYTPWGWMTFGIGVVAGALYGAYVAAYTRRHFPTAYEEETGSSREQRTMNAPAPPGSATRR